MKKYLVLLSANDRIIVEAETWELTNQSPHGGNIDLVMRIGSKEKARFNWLGIMGVMEAEHVRADLK